MSSELDETILRRNSGDDILLMRELLDLFCCQAKIWSKTLDAGLEPSIWADTCHTIKGAAAGIGASGLAEACDRAEKQGRRQMPLCQEDAEKLLSEIKARLSMTIKAIRQNPIAPGQQER